MKLRRTGAGPVEFRRIDALPPYVFAEVDRLKRDLRHEGHDVVDLGTHDPAVRVDYPDKAREIADAIPACT